MDNKELCMALVKSETEEDVIAVLKRAGYWDDKDAWQYYGGHENNFQTIGNQQSLPESALVEKIINSVDAMLMKECLIRRINPEGPDAPKSVTEAIEKFFGVRGGVLSNMHAPARGKLAENICVVATGSKSNPCYSIIDLGEGQAPDSFSKTFLSIRESNKLRIPFVQGKFNMGGTGVLQFCGRNNLQLIISKRHPEITKNEKNRDNSAALWGFTVVRRFDPKGGVRSSVYAYLAPKKILTFDSPAMEILPSEYPNSSGNKMGYGTFIKLYEYQMPGGLKTNIKFDLYYRLSLLLPNIALPVRLFERRRGYTADSYETTLSGLSVRLDEDKRDNVEEGFPSSSSISVNGQEMKCQIYAFKKGQSKKYVKHEGIIFTRNGQTHGYIPNTFFERKSVGMSYLADSIIVMLDCSKFDGRTGEDIFMNSRDRLRECYLKNEIERELEELIKNHTGLRALRERRRREEIQKQLADSRPLREVLEDILKRSPTLSELFLKGRQIQKPFDMEGIGGSGRYTGKEFPTFFKLEGSGDTKVLTKQCPINSKFRVKFITDASNDYFERDNFPGQFGLFASNESVKNYVLNLWNGLGTLTVSLPSDCKVGDKLIYRWEVRDRMQNEPFSGGFEAVVNMEAKRETSGGGRRHEPPGNDEKQNGSGLDLPNIIEVHEAEWAPDGPTIRNRFDALAVLDAGENRGYDYYVNMDNVYLLSELKHSSGVEPDLLKNQFKYAMVLVGIALLRKREETVGNNEDGLRQIREITYRLSPIIIPLIHHLGDIAEAEKER